MSTVVTSPGSTGHIPSEQTIPAGGTQLPTDYRPGIPDWSTVHQLSGALASPLIGKSEWATYQWSQSLVDEFHNEGFVSHVKVLTEEQCDQLLHDYKYFLDETHPGMEMMYKYSNKQAPEGPDNIVIHAEGQWRLTNNFHDLVFLPQIIVPVSQCLGNKPIRFWEDQLFAKPAKYSGLVAWHHDYSLWRRTKPQCHVTVHIALGDQTEENGTIKYIPGSHRWTRDGEQIPCPSRFNFKNMEGIKGDLTPEELEKFQPVSAMLKKGEASFHHGLNIHGSYNNKSDQPRIATVLNYFADGVVSDTDDELFKGTGIIPKGQRLDGQFFPLVYDPAWTQETHFPL